MLIVFINGRFSFALLTNYRLVLNAAGDEGNYSSEGVLWDPILWDGEIKYISDLCSS
jgi:hypothetical protein